MPPITPPPTPPTPQDLPVSRGKRVVKTSLYTVLALLVLFGVFLFIHRNDPKAPVDTTYANAATLEYTAPNPGTPVRYVALQIFTSNPLSKELSENIPSPGKALEKSVGDIIQTIGTVGTANNKLAFVVGPIAFDQSDEEVRGLIRDSFAIALKTNVAVGFHIDDSMFWGRLSQLNTIQNIEWLDWNKTPNTGRRLDWSAKPTKLMPQLCLNSAAVTQAVKDRATLIGQEVEKGRALLKAAGKEDLFAGVIAGWETQIGRDFETGKTVGYCALTNKGYSAKNPPADIDQARVDIIKDFIGLWTGSLASAGVPEEKIYSHVAFMPQINSQGNNASVSYSQMVNFAPPTAAVGAHHSPGFSTYPNSWNIGEVEKILEGSGNPPWISAEGTALDPAQAELGGTENSMEPYLGGLFNHGAVLVNVFGWGVGPADNPFRQTTENRSAVLAYQKFLSGTALSETLPAGTSSSGSLQDKIHTIQNTIETWAPAHKDKQGALIEQSNLLQKYLAAGDLKNANSVADAMLKIMGL